MVVDEGGSDVVEGSAEVVVVVGVLLVVVVVVVVVVLELLNWSTGAAVVALLEGATLDVDSITSCAVVVAVVRAVVVDWAAAAVSPCPAAPVEAPAPPPGCASVPPAEEAAGAAAWRLTRRWRRACWSVLEWSVAIMLSSRRLDCRRGCEGEGGRERGASAGCCPRQRPKGRVDGG